MAYEGSGNSIFSKAMKDLGMAYEALHHQRLPKVLEVFSQTRSSEETSPAMKLMTEIDD